MFSPNQITPGSLALLRGIRATFGTFRGDGAFIRLDTRTVVPVVADDVFTSRGNVMNAAVRHGTARLTGSSMGIAALDLRARSIYLSPFDAIRNASVFDNTDEATKDALCENVAAFYVLGDAE